MQGVKPQNFIRKHMCFYDGHQDPVHIPQRHNFYIVKIKKSVNLAGSNKIRINFAR